MFKDDFHAYKNRILKYSDKFPDMTEEATKNALIMPFFVLLGYDVFDPNEIMPEYICDVAMKKGEKIDYAIMRDGDPVILVEAKRAGLKLQKQQQDQLYRYFSTNRCRIAVLTNGITYLFFSDINYPNVMMMIHSFRLMFWRTMRKFFYPHWDSFTKIILILKKYFQKLFS